MRSRFAALACVIGLFALADCEAKAAHDYPPHAQAEFHRQCPASEPVCVCTWDGITRAMTYEDYQAAMERFSRQGLMDPRLTRVKMHCREQHPQH